MKVVYYFNFLYTCSDTELCNMVLPTAAFEEMKQELSKMKNENESLDRNFTYLVTIKVLVLGDIVHSKTSPILRYFTATSIIRVYSIPTGEMENC